MHHNLNFTIYSIYLYILWEFKYHININYPLMLTQIYFLYNFNFNLSITIRGNISIIQ